MEPITQLEGVAASLMINDVDTDQIIPGKDLMKVEKTGFEKGLFANWRFLPDGAPDPDFILNKPPFNDATFLVSGSNFGCGSSRASAVWALRDFGIRCVVASSFGSIFQSNCHVSGVLPVVLPEDQVQAIVADLAIAPRLQVDLESCTLVSARRTYTFYVPKLAREMLLSGKDPISVTLNRDALIRDFQDVDRQRRPWVYDIVEKAEQGA
ncbi:MULTISPECIES: 3-isopropylmalate dehydratase small subunit [unclassified Sphingomonas]|uniref:3-isopropylmalate dehydratase small subunit n=1 Tax=unclassified Sphingomonas TaxID=196159 RepID=UPI00070206FC|nr:MULTISPECIES: 3-isopropylmalate dehydratase small subunit [unclassified Sphingomonas]KQX19109.1 3-isopropylmalate dehydratase [Sphingomonas sp. Root1294]KQY65310.1 3-isopropylmalate dehydratase [Sphingomonas sp. Root50]KRB95395.1 3-isopropylmalate dehydratase [Sphingomonas sp. Root720]